MNLVNLMINKLPGKYVHSLVRLEMDENSKFKA